MRLGKNPAILLFCCCAVVLMGFGEGLVRAADAGMRLEALLVWGTNDSRSPNPRHIPVGAELDRKLKRLFKWTNYFEVNRVAFDVPATGVVKVPVSEKCAIEVKRLPGGAFEVGYIGKGKAVERRIADLAPGKCLIYGGDAPNSTSYFVVIKRVE